jgi:hypothetical protein
MKVRMDGIGIPIAGAVVSLALFLVCRGTPRLKRFALAALVAPFASSVVFMVGSFILADMNPAVEYGSSYIPTGNEHDPTKGDVLLWLASVAATFFLSAFVCLKIQGLFASILRRIGWPRTTLRNASRS